MPCIDIIQGTLFLSLSFLNKVDLRRGMGLSLQAVSCRLSEIFVGKTNASEPEFITGFGRRGKKRKEERMNAEQQAVLQATLAILLAIAAMAWLFAGPGAAMAVLQSPFRLCGIIVRGLGWLLRGVLTALGGALSRIARDTHRYFYRRWPGATVAFYLLVIAAVIIYLLF